jgi:hypothetical protein
MNDPWKDEQTFSANGGDPPVKSRPQITPIAPIKSRNQRNLRLFPETRNFAARNQNISG